MESEDCGGWEQTQALWLETCPAKVITNAAANSAKGETAQSLHDIMRWLFGSFYTVCDLMCVMQFVQTQSQDFSFKLKSHSKGEKGFMQDINFKSAPADCFIWECSS